MSRVLLLNPPGDVIRTGRLVRKSKISNQSWQPIMLAYAAGVLEKSGFDVKLVDASVSNQTELEIYVDVKRWKPDHIAYYWAYDSAGKDLPFADWLGFIGKSRGFDVTLVGPWSAHMPDALDKIPHVRNMTFGQFEYTLSILYSGEYDEKDVPGLKYREGEQIFFNSQRHPYNEVELDWMPFVTDVYRRHLDLKAYHQTSFRYPFIDLFTARSCPSRCGFCSWINGYDQLHPHRYQQRSLRNVMDELWFIKDELPEIKQVFFQDSTLVSPRAREISQAMLDENLHLCWGAYSRADKDYDTLKLMKDAGCRTLHVGYEAPIQGILDEIQKDITVEQEARFIKDVNRLKLWTSSSFMIFPWMTPKQIMEMVNWIKVNGATRINIAQLQAYPNTPIMDVISSYKNVPGERLMTFDEMKKWEQYGFREFYLKNPKFWWEVLRSPRELVNTAKDALGMLGFLWS